jgi:hypothetical protein
MNILNLITGIVSPVINGVFRWKSESDKMEVSRQDFDLMKLRLQNDIEVRVAEELRKPESDFRSFVLDYEGKASEQPEFMRNFRSSVRPIITYWALGSISAIMFGWVDGTKLQANLAAVPEPLWQIFLAIFGFWFGGRAAMQVALAWKKK